MGLFDDPENQRQDTFALDLASAGNVAVVGAMATGKSVFLQTFVYGLVMRYSPAEVNIYAIDFSAKMLAAFENAPHMGGFMNEEDTEKISKFLAFLGRMLEARKKLLKGGSFEQYITLHGQGSIPAVVIVIDNYSGFQAKADLTEQNEEFMVRLSKEGVRVIVIDYASSLGKICGEVNAEHITTEEQFYQLLAGFLPEFEARNVRRHELLDEGMEEDEIFVRMQQFEKICFFIDDFPGFVEKTYETKEDPERVGEYYELLEQILDFGTLHNIYWFVCVNKKDTARVDIYTLHDLFLRDKKGIHLGGITDDSMMNFDHLPYGLRDQVMPAGKGLLPVDNEDNVDEIIIPLVKSSAGAMQAES